MHGQPARVNQMPPTSMRLSKEAPDAKQQVRITQCLASEFSAASGLLYKQGVGVAPATRSRELEQKPCVEPAAWKRAEVAKERCGESPANLCDAFFEKHRGEFGLLWRALTNAATSDEEELWRVAVQAVHTLGLGLGLFENQPLTDVERALQNVVVLSLSVCVGLRGLGGLAMDHQDIPEALEARIASALEKSTVADFVRIDILKNCLLQVARDVMPGLKVSRRSPTHTEEDHRK